MCVQLAVLLVLCQGTGFSGIHYSTSQAQVELSTARQLNQTINLIKSIALFSTSATAACPVHVVTMSRPETLFATIKERVDGWAPAFRDRLKLTGLPVGGFPEGETVQEQLFGNVAGRNRLCSHSRTFWPWVLKNQAATASVELALDFDTDIILLQPIEKLWGYFQNFTGSTLLSMAQCDNCWVYSSNTRDIRPYPVNTTGYNAGVKHLNLTRILGRGGWWLEEHRLAFKKYGGNVVWMHQDLLNIIAYHHPEVLLNLPCYTNIRGHTATQCLGTAAAGGGGGSGDAVAMGAGFEAVHGAGYVFAERYKKVKKKTYVPKIFMYEVSRAFQEYDMTRYSRSAVRELAAAVQARLEDAIRGFPAVLDAPPSPPPGALPYNGISQQTPPPPAGGADPEWRGTAERLKRMIVGSILKYADDTALAWQGPAAAATAA